MSKIIASAAIRGAHKIVARAEEALKKALEQYGPDKAVEFPNTGYFLPVIYAITGMEVRTISDMKPVLDRTKSLLPPYPEEHVWLPYLGHTLDAGMATLFADEIIEAIKYLQNPVPYTMTPSPTEENLWLGAADDVIMRERGIEFVDGSAPGFAACVGACPTNEIAVQIARELQEKNLYIFMSADTNGRSMAEQLAEEGVQMGWETRLVPFGKDITATVFALGFACRAAMAFGGVKPGDFRRILLYNKNRIFAFVIALGEVDDEKYAQAAGAINFGFPTIADTPIPQILPTGICTYEHVVSDVPHSKIVGKAIEVRGLKIMVTKMPIPVAYGPAFEGERVRKEDCYLEMGGGKTHAFELLRMKEAEEVEDGKIALIGPDIDSLPEHSQLPIGIVVDVFGRKMQKDFEPILERQLHHFVTSAEGVLHIGQRDIVWLRISKNAKEKGFKLHHLGEIINAKLRDDYGAIVDKVQVTIYTEQAKVDELLEEVRKIYAERDARIAGMTDESVDTFYSCTLCVPKGEEIVFADGSFKSVEKVIKDEVEGKNSPILSLDTSHLKAKSISELFINPAPKSLLKINLSNGNSLNLTPNHKVLTDTTEGLVWMPASKLKQGDRLLSPITTNLNSDSSENNFYVIDFLPDVMKVYDNEYLLKLREKVVNNYESLASAAREFDFPYKKLYQALYFRNNISYKLGRSRFTLGELKLIISKLGLNWDTEKVRMRIFGTSRGSRLQKNVLDEDLMYASGLIASDGCVVRRQNGTFVQFTNSEQSLIKKFSEIMQSFFGSSPKITKQEPRGSTSNKLEINGTSEVTILHVHNSVIGPLMRGLGVGRCKERKRKWTGEIISTLPERFIAAFLKGLFDGDGHLTKSHISITTRSHKEAQHIMLLLKKLGIASYITKITRGWQVGTRNYRDFMRFRSSIGSEHPAKKAKMEKATFSFDENHVVRTDTVPLFCRRLLSELLYKGTRKTPLTKLPVDYKTVEAWVKGKSPVSKEKLRLLLDGLQSEVDASNVVYRELRKWSDSAIVFEKIVSIEKVEYQENEVYNFSVEDTHNYLVNGVVVKNCQSFAPTHVCMITPERLGLCGAYNWLDARTSFEINPTGPNQPVLKGEVIDSVKGQWKGVNEFVYEHSQQKTERFNSYSVMEDPETSCGCFQCIVAILPMCSGVMIVNREFLGMTPCGMKFSTLAGTVGGGVQIPGFIGIGRPYITSAKFIAAEGGFKRIVWMPKELKDALRSQLLKRAEEIGMPDFIDKVADETIATTEEEVINFMQKVGHPALEMEPML